MAGKQKVQFEISSKDRTKQAFSSVKKGLKGLTSGAGKLTGALGLVTGALAVAALAKFSKEALDAGDKIQKLSIKLGVSTEALSQYKLVSELSGVEFKTLTKGMQDLAAKVADASRGMGEGKEALKLLGLQADKLKNLSIEKQFETVADALLKVENQTDKVSVAYDLFGGRGVQLLQVMKDGAGGIRKMREEADALGLTLTQEAADAMAETNDNLTRLGSGFDGLVKIMVEQALPGIDGVVKSLTEIAKSDDAKQFAQDFGEIMVLAAESARTLASGLISASTAFNEFVGFVAESRAVLKIEELSAAQTELGRLMQLRLDAMNKGVAPTERLTLAIKLQRDRVITLNEQLVSLNKTANFAATGSIELTAKMPKLSKAIKTVSAAVDTTNSSLEKMRQNVQAGTLLNLADQAAKAGKELVKIGKDLERERKTLEDKRLQGSIQLLSRLTLSEEEFLDVKFALLDEDLRRFEEAGVEKDLIDRVRFEERNQLVREHADRQASDFEEGEKRKAAAGDGFFASMKRGFKGFSETAGSTSLLVEQTTKNMINNIQGGISDSIFNFVKGIGSFKDAIKGFFTSILDSFIRLVADMIAQAALIEGIKLFSGGSSALSIGASSASGASSVVSTGATGLKLARAGSSSVSEAGSVSSEVTSFTEQGAAEASATSSSKLLEGAGTAFSGAAAGFAGRQAAGLVTAGGKNADIGSSLGGGLGFALGGPLGAAIGSFFGGTIGGLFTTRLSLTEKRFGALFKEFRPNFDDPFSALAFTRLQVPGTGGDNVADAINALVGRDTFPGTSFLRDGEGPESVDSFTVRGFKNLIASGKSSREQIENLLTGDLAKFIGAFGNGGIVNSPGLALVGERGPEAVIPLRGGNVPVTINGGEMVELLRGIRDAVENSGGGQTVELKLDGDVLAKSQFRRSKAGLRTIHPNGVFA